MVFTFTSIRCLRSGSAMSAAPGCGGALRLYECAGSSRAFYSALRCAPAQPVLVTKAGLADSAITWPIASSWQTSCIQYCIVCKRKLRCGSHHHSVDLQPARDTLRATETTESLHERAEQGAVSELLTRLPVQLRSCRPSARHFLETKMRVRLAHNAS